LVASRSKLLYYAIPTMEKQQDGIVLLRKPHQALLHHERHIYPPNVTEFMKILSLGGLQLTYA
jgi:hypothetical protein